MDAAFTVPEPFSSLATRRRVEGALQQQMCHGEKPHNVAISHVPEVPALCPYSPLPQWLEAKRHNAAGARALVPTSSFMVSNHWLIETRLGRTSTETRTAAVTAT